MTFGRHFQVIFEFSPMGIMIMDSSGMILLGNAVARRMLGEKPEALHGSSLTEYVHPDDSPEFGRLYQNLTEQPNGSFNFESRLRQSEEYRWCRLSFTHVAAGSFSPFIFAVLEDITDQRSGVERLLKEKEVAERATQTKSAFLANMSHEIRTPIHTITGMTELLHETKLDAEQKEYADQIRYSAEVLLGLINDILDFSKIEAGRLGLEMLECDIVSLIEEAVDMVSLLAHKKNLEVLIDIDRSVSRWVRVDPVRIRQIIINLFNNAVKFTPSGEIRIRVSLLERTGNIQKVKTEIIDTGIGIPEDKLALLFQAFSQVDSSTTRKFGGTGLGLSISKSLVKMMNGTIDVASVKGRGSNFCFSLPLEIIPEREEEAEPIFEESAIGNRVLIVDDNEASRDVLYSHLSDWFKRVEMVPSGKEALERLQKAAAAGDPFTLGLIDLHMPGMDGWQFASEVHNDELLNSIRLVLMSPTGSGTEAKMKLLGWFDGYINKPVKRGELLDCVASVTTNEKAFSLPREEEPDEVEELVDETDRSLYSILVAEDHLVNQQLFKTILEKMGYTIHLASNGLEAVETAKSRKIDLVFMDVQMPEMNGYEAAQKIRELGLAVPIVAVTANALKGERERCLEAGMNDYLTKPFKSKDLLPYLSRWLTVPGAVKGAEASESEEKQEDGREGKSSPPIFDFNEAVDSFMGKKDVVVKVVRGFITKVENQIETMKTALISGDWENLRIESHGIKGGSWNLSAKRLGDTAALLEQAAKDRNARTAAENLIALEKEFAVFREYLVRQPEFQDR